METSKLQADIGHEIGDNNVEKFGLDIHNPVFAISAILVVSLVIGTLAFGEAAAVVFGDLRNWITTTFDWFFILTVNIFVVFCFAVAFSPLGRVRLGGNKAYPTFSYPAWLAMLFAAGVGIGLMFYGVLEPVTHTLNPPLGIDPADTATAMSAGLSAAVYHWGLHAWATYAVVGLALAFFCFNRGMPLTLRSAFYPLFGKAIWGPLGHFIDIMPTLMEISGAEYPKTHKGNAITPYEGKSLLAAFKGKTAPRKKPIFWQWSRGKAVMKGKWKLVAWGNKWELFRMCR